MKFAERPQKRHKTLKSISFLPHHMPKDDRIEMLLKEHEELVSLYIHESKVKWNLISVYIALSVGLVSAVTVLIQREEIARLGAASFLCFMGFLFSCVSALLFKRNQDQTSEWIDKGIEVEKTLKEIALTIGLFKICKNARGKKRPKILNGMWFLTILWFIVAIGMALDTFGLVDVPFFA